MPQPVERGSEDQDSLPDTRLNERITHKLLRGYVARDTAATLLRTSMRDRLAPSATMTR
jgi:hypothetical protein